ncbi:TPA: hypothetical protein ACTY0G_005094 [Klebsiella pneumoniae]|nr:hypothetical protein [Salmonella enterica]
MTTLKAKRQQLHDIRLTAEYMRQRKLPPAQSASILVGVVVAIVAAVLHWTWVWSGIVGIIAGLFVFCFMPLSRSWAELLDDKLTAYEPEDAAAYAELHQTTIELGGIDLNALDLWCGKEWFAITPVQPHGPARKFIDKPLNRNKGQSDG